MPVNTSFLDESVLYAANLNSAFAQSASISGDNFTGPLSINNIDIGSGLRNAYNTANAAFQAANTNSIAGIAFNQANNALNLAQASFSEANSFQSVINSAFLLANSTTNLVGSSYNEANLAASIAQSAFNKANSVGFSTSITFIAGQSLTANGNTSASVTGNATVTFAANVATTTTTGVVQLNDTTTSTSPTLAATANAVNTVWAYAQSAFILANATNNYATSAYSRANTLDGIGTFTLTGSNGIAINGGGISTLSSNGTLNLTANNGSTTTIGVVQLNDTTTSQSTSLAATANAVNTAMVYAKGAFNQANSAIGGGSVNVSVVTSGSVFNIAPTSYAIVVNKTVGGNTLVNLLSSSPAVGTIYIIKDGKGDCATNNITVNANITGVTIDGSANVVLNINRQSLTLLWDGTQYNIF